VLIGLTGIVACLRAEDAAEANDLQLTLRARQALTADMLLAHCHLGISVRQSVATLWGDVPSIELCQRAENRIRQVPGILQIVNDLRVRSKAASATQAPATPEKKKTSDTPIPRPGHASAALADRENHGRIAGTTAGRPSLPPIVLQPVQPQAIAPVLLSPPIRLESAQGLEERLRELTDADKRFHDLRAAVIGKMVYLRGSVPAMEDVFILAQEVSRLPGVERVIIEHVRAAGSR
jgi:hypothetical protein